MYTGKQNPLSMWHLPSLQTVCVFWKVSGVWSRDSTLLWLKHFEKLQSQHWEPGMKIVILEYLKKLKLHRPSLHTKSRSFKVHRLGLYEIFIPCASLGFLFLTHACWWLTEENNCSLHNYSDWESFCQGISLCII